MSFSSSSESVKASSPYYPPVTLMRGDPMLALRPTQPKEKPFKASSRINAGPGAPRSKWSRRALNQAYKGGRAGKITKFVQTRLELKAASPPQAEPKALADPLKKEYVEWIEKLEEATFASNQEDRIQGLEDVLSSIPINDASEFAIPESMFFSGLCFVRLAENHFNLDLQEDNFKEAVSRFQQVADSGCPYFEDARYWEGYCHCSLTEKAEEQEERFCHFDQARDCFSKMRGVRYFWDIKYVLGHCQYWMAVAEVEAKDRLKGLRDAEFQFKFITDKEHPVYSLAQSWAARCTLEIAQITGSHAALGAPAIS